MVDIFRTWFASLPPSEREICAEEVIVFLDELGYPSPDLIRLRSLEIQLRRYQNEYGELHPRGMACLPEGCRSDSKLPSINPIFERELEIEDCYYDEVDYY